jgi:diaminopimelate decarboxylase
MTEHMALVAVEKFGSPVYLYCQATLEDTAQHVKQCFQQHAHSEPSSVVVRFAMKACPNAAVLKILHNQGIHIDSSSAFEAQRAILAGIPGPNILVTAQELPYSPAQFEDLKQKGVQFTACSLRQIEWYAGHGLKSISLRVNPGLGSGHNARTSVGGSNSSFGIWYEQLELAVQMCQRLGLTIERLHCHIGSGADPDKWLESVKIMLGFIQKFGLAAKGMRVLNIGGGFKVQRMPTEKRTDLTSIASVVLQEINSFCSTNKCTLGLEIEPGGYMCALAGKLLCKVADVVKTDKFQFIKVDAGMSEILRPCMYGAQHPISLIRQDQRTPAEETEFVIVGHCCESGDILTPESQDPEKLSTRRLPTPKIGDIISIGAAGAYCSSMTAKNYNSFPEAAEVLMKQDKTLSLIRRRQTLKQMIQNELIPSNL